MADKTKGPHKTPSPRPPAKPVAEGGASKAEHKPPAPAAPVGPPDPAPPANVPVPEIITALQTAVPGAVTHISYWVGDWTVVVPATQLLDVARHLRSTGFDFCSDVTASDWPPRPQRFDVVYSLDSTRE